MTVRRTIQLGDPRLKADNQTVINFNSPKVKQIITDLIDTMKHIGLIGIAAPQIGENYEIFVTQPRKTKVRKLPFKDKVRIYINPTIETVSDKKHIIWEGCGCVSVKDLLFGPVMRPKEITLTAFDEKGKKFKLHCDGILARVIQHEVDHLNGIEFIEKVSDYRKLMHEKHYTKTVRNSKEQDEASKVTIFEVSRE